MAHRTAMTHTPTSSTWQRPLRALLASLVTLVLVTGCGAADEPEGVGQPGQPQDSQPAAATQPGVRVITTYAGTGSPKFTGDGESAEAAGLYQPAGLAVDDEGNLFISSDKRVRRVDAATGIITTVAGSGRSSGRGDGGPATSADFRGPAGLAVDNAGNLFIADHGNGRIRKVDAATGIVETIAGGGIFDRRSRKVGDGGPAIEALVHEPTDVAVDSNGNVYIVSNHRVRMVDELHGGVIATIAGNGGRGLSGDQGPAAAAQLAGPTGVAVDGMGHIYIADTENHRVRRIDANTGLITTAAGIGSYSAESCFEGCTHGSGGWSTLGGVGAGYAGDEGPAVEAMLRLPTSVSVSADGVLFIAEGGIRIREVSAATGVITTLAAGETEVSYETGKVNVVAGDIGRIVSIAVNDRGEIFVADIGNSIVHKVSASAGP